MLDFTSEPRFLFTSSCTSGLRISRVTDDHVTMDKDKWVIHKFKGFQTKSKGASWWRIEFQGIINWTSGKKIVVYVNIGFDLRYLSITLREYFEMLRRRKRIFFTHESGLSMIRVNWQILGEQVVKKHGYIVAGSLCIRVLAWFVMRNELIVCNT